MTTMPPEVPLAELPGELLRARVARAQMYLIYAESTGISASSEVEARSLAYLDLLDRQGRLFGYGQLDPGSGDSDLELAIVAAASREEAELIAENEPFHQTGARRNRVQAHTMNEGVACYIARAMSMRAIATHPLDLKTANGEARLEHGPVSEATPLYLIPLVPTDRPRLADDLKTMDAHFVWLRENEMSAKLLSCGPVVSPTPLAQGIWGGGLGIVATSREEAEGIAKAEPSGQAGYRALSVRGWALQRGLAKPVAEALHRLNSLPS